MQCFIYKCALKPDTYIFLSSEGAFDVIPSSLREALGHFIKIMDLQLTPDRKLARADASEVMSALHAHGYYLQMPPVD